MPCVTECDDSWLSNVLADPIDDEDVWAALDAVTSDPVEEGCVGSGTGMQCFDFKGGSAPRRGSSTGIRAASPSVCS